MKRIAVWALAACYSTIVFATASVTAPVGAPDLTAEQIVEKNVVARGGLEAWRKIQSMAWLGHIERGNAPGPRVPFALEQKRPNKTRFEIMTDKQQSVRVYDGNYGWKMRPGSSGRPELLAYTTDELSVAHDAQVIDGPLVDYRAKGISIALEGKDRLEGRDAYRLRIKLPSGASQRVWIDAESFLDIRYDRSSRNSLGQPSTVSVFYRNFQAFEGLQIPLTIETGAPSGNVTDKMVIDKIALNPPLEDRMFAKLSLPGARRNAVTVDTRAPQANVVVAKPAK
jgi:outer membrane lipoprotein-sorting protein